MALRRLRITRALLAVLLAQTAADFRLGHLTSDNTDDDDDDDLREGKGYAVNIFL